jgi:hypothetical protein
MDDEDDDAEHMMRTMTANKAAGEAAAREAQHIMEGEA